MIAIHLSSQLKFWESLCAALDRADLLTDSRFDTRAKRIDRYFDLKCEFQRTVGSRSQHEWLARLTAFDVPHAPINTLDEVLGDAQVRALDSFAAISLSPSVTLTVPRRPVWIDGSRTDQPMSAAPALNQDGERVIATLGLTEDELARWRDSQVQKGSA
jgi:crotonobetainyl-CoA:carnitine CoA-transferase CaiB-like acyl-CoA transferase